MPTGEDTHGCDYFTPVFSTAPTLQQHPTAGNEGSSLVRGVQMQLKAIALSVKRGGKIQHLHVGGQISTSGADVATVEIDDTIEHFSVAGAIRATGDRSDAIHTRRGCVNLSGVDATALHGSDLVETN